MSKFRGYWQKIFTLYATVKGKLLKKVSIGIFAFNPHRMVKILKYNFTKKHHTWNRSCLGLTFKFLENQL